MQPHPNKLRLKLIATMSYRKDSQIDVAYHAKVSQSTISRFVRGRDCSWSTRSGIIIYINREKAQENQIPINKSTEEKYAHILDWANNNLKL